MKSQKSFAMRGTLAIVAAGSALALTACGAGQITQTSSQVAAVNGVNGQVENASVRDVAVVIGPDNGVALKFTAGNVENKGNPIHLQSVTVDGQDVSGVDAGEIKPGCNLVADEASVLKSIEKGASKTCNTFAATEVDGVKDLYVGGHKDVTFTFDVGTIDVSAPVTAYNPEAGTLYRDGGANLVDEKEYHEGEGHH